MNSLLSLVAICSAALALDHWWGEPRRGHPLVFFGRQADRVERWLNRSPDQNQNQDQGTWGEMGRGGFAVLVLVAPLLLVGILAARLPEPLLWIVQVFVLWSALSLRGLTEHAQAVAKPLTGGDLAQARLMVARIVSRRAEALDETGVAAAASESVLENGADAVFASLFWFLVAGIPGVVAHRAVNTLDAMWGYRNARFLTFGRAAARLDDVLNWIPARLTALTYALVGDTRLALRCWRAQAPLWDSPNAGPVMAAGAGALGLTLGGPAPYADGMKQRPALGAGPAPTAAAITASVRLVRRGVGLWLIFLMTLALASALGPALSISGGPA